jgi:hypothetical protein
VRSSVDTALAAMLAVAKKGQEMKPKQQASGKK